MASCLKKERITNDGARKRARKRPFSSEQRGYETTSLRDHFLDANTFPSGSVPYFGSDVNTASPRFGRLLM
ncbi:hypothetical protein HPB50_023408 [Hyalomma asiaticum]|uniref:Uncharacterized protein n=1 Tax=Hyalomma asiaticum TaxID=266040 RepID=A0ACB7S307_HYAAI|nr:hypothetical protein HPB50_023408 [Hyalomma asiaticum]